MKKMENVADIYPLTPVQQGMLYHTLSDPESEIYVEQIRCDLVGPLDVNKLIAAWDFVINHYPALRTAFLWEKLDEPLQIVRRTVSPSWDLKDWQGNHANTTRNLDLLAEEYWQARFNLASAPLMSFALIQLDDESHHFIWNSHHLILDGWSTHQIFNDAFNVYEIFNDNRQPYLPPTKPFRHYIAWLKKQDIGAAEKYWREMLAGFHTPTPLQVEKNLSTTSIVYGEATKKLSTATTSTLEHFSRQNRITLNTVVQGAWALLLSRYSAQNDVVFGNTVSGRPAELPGVEKMVGMCINTLPVRVELAEEQLLIPWLQQIQEQQVTSRRYEYSPLAKVQQWSDIPPGRALFDSIVVFENFPASDENAPRLLEIHDVQRRELSNYPLALLIHPGVRLELKLIYNSERFDQDAVGRLLKHLQTILETIALQSPQTLAEIPLLDNKEREKLLVKWNNTNTPIETEDLLFKAVGKHAARKPNAEAVIAQDGSLTYAQLNERANQLAHCLSERGVKPGSTVGLFTERSLLMLVGIIGIQTAGAALNVSPLF
jgi:hypothetical protein